MEPAEPLPEYIFGISERFEEAIASKSTRTEKRSPDLVPLTKEFETMRKRLRQLIVSAKKYHETAAALDKSRVEVRTQQQQQLGLLLGTL